MKYYIIDGMNLAYRSHNAHFEAQTADGKPSGMIFGFIRMIFSLKKKNRGYKFIVVWDHRPEHKYEIYPEYKAGRPSMHPGVVSQLDDIRLYLQHCGVDQYEKKGQEADDVIATLVERFKSDGAELCVIYSNDKDMLQLVEDGKVVVHKPKVGNVPEIFYDEEAVKKQFGVRPNMLATYRCFDGDASDNISGVSRVPRKIIAKLVLKYEEPDAIYSNLDRVELTEFQKKSFADSKNQVLMNKKLITLNKNISDLSKTSSDFQLDTLNNILRTYEIKSINQTLMIDLFKSDLNIKYSDAQQPYKLETLSLF